MDIVFFGTSESALPSLRGLIDSRHKVLAVVTQPDRERGRLLRLSPPATKVLATAKGIPVYQPRDVSSAESAGYLRKMNADLFVVIAFGQILKGEVLEIPKVYSINLHFSLLPKYRGAAPTNWAIINGDKSSGVTIIRMNEKMDEGDIIVKKEVDIDDEDTNITLSEKLSQIGAEAFIDIIGRIEDTGSFKFERQDEGSATYAPKLKKSDGLIDWTKDAGKIHNMVRGFIPWPGAYTHYKAKTLKILKTSLFGASSENGKGPGEVVDIAKDDGIIVNTGSGLMKITHLQLEGKKALDSASFLRGHRIEKGYVFD